MNVENVALVALLAEEYINLKKKLEKSSKEHARFVNERATITWVYNPGWGHNIEEAATLPVKYVEQAIRIRIEDLARALSEAGIDTI